ncbi:hypothetical protein [Streptomyces sp.]|uniref:hypothetical protein n=1 Tax=Streptomyces sp. TaxID=1931 RepID=UPI002F40B749
MAESTRADTPEEPEAAAARKEAARAERRAARLARQIGAFARHHGGGAEASLAYIGERGTRIVLVAADGAWGDLVAPTYAVARAAADRAGVTVHETLDGELAAKMRTGSYEWSRMAGIQIGGRTRR